MLLPPAGLHIYNNERIRMRDIRQVSINPDVDVEVELEKTLASSPGVRLFLRMLEEIHLEVLDEVDAVDVPAVGQVHEDLQRIARSKAKARKARVSR